jgi:glycosyltransferase involved in cell wall biosynthesis
MAPEISVLVPVYNREKYIVECVSSILMQRFSSFEVVIVDNKSTDNTWALCQELSRKDKRVRVFQNNSNIGPVLNWIRCVEEARGGYSKIVFSDDLLLEGCLEKMHRACADDDVAFVFSAAKIGSSTDMSTISYQNASDSLMTFDEYVGRLLSHLAPLSPGAIMLRTKDLKKNLMLDIPTSTPRQFLKNGAGPDVLISLITASNYSYVSCIREPLVFFRAHEESFSICDINDEVTLGYVSAISFFLKFNAPRYWLKYVAISWIKQMVRHRAWNSPREYLVKHEGDGSVVEILRLLNQAVILAFRKALKVVGVIG